MYTYIKLYIYNDHRYTTTTVRSLVFDSLTTIELILIVSALDNNSHTSIFVWYIYISKHPAYYILLCCYFYFDHLHSQVNHISSNYL